MHPSRSARPSSSVRIIAAVAVAAMLVVPRRGWSDVILQYFEGKWETIERRMPDIFVAGYDGGLWVPPPQVADSGGFSVGYDTFDRFDLGSRHRPTLYGTDQSFTRMSRELDLVGIPLYIDTVYNHNGFRDASTTGFIDAGDYPGFVVRTDNDVDGDFHGAFAGGDLEMRLAGLIDIAQEKNHQFIRHPATQDAANIPNEPVKESNRAFYPDRDLPQIEGRFVFNIADPMQGDPISENATGLTLRWTQWLVETRGVDGFRIDAIKHVPTWFFNDFYDNRVHNLRVLGNGERRTPFSFGENYTGDLGLLAAYIRKDGFGNRDALDFPLHFKMGEIFGGEGFGDIGSLAGASVDIVDGDANDGTRGVQFVSSHDQGPPSMDNPAYAHILTRPGYPLVYFNAKEFGDNRDFPKSGRGDALGGQFGDFPVRLTRIHNVYGSGNIRLRWQSGDVYCYERSNSMIVGLTDRRDSGYEQITIDTDFRNITLTELTGTATSGSVDPNNDIFDFIQIGNDGRATIRIPRGSSSSGFHGNALVIYGMAPPRGGIIVNNATGTIEADPPETHNSVRRLTSLPVVTANTINLTLQIDQGGPNEDNALIKVNDGLDFDTNPGLISGRFGGYENFTTSSPSVGGGTGTYTAQIPTTTLTEGPNYISAIAFHPRNSGEPPVFTDVRIVVYLDKIGPLASLLFPGRTGTDDVQSSSYETVVEVDRTADSVHVIPDVPLGLTDDQIVALANETNRANRVDRLQWRWNWQNISSGTHSLTVVAFEPSGNRSITRFEGIGANVPVTTPSLVAVR